ncbi:hypothetical protein [Mobilicoccus pelagius]|uniref:Uncharacterized protein n=1 Tax=Mobilicoccus pelagius NBRC 104925 TaxID=1089455 RepID=H5UQ21_9MICO|nr:hypothetical protein [Mobilicoccus pelagius]GAB47826.1 hypothetical protein MOPEL_029_01070 [Mobilicoccus pelagius NBRC 104925]
MNHSDTDTRRWIDDMVVELRLRDVKGAAIGDAVASVESHCADSSETPREAFGDPREYAASLTFPQEDRTGDTIREWATVMAPVVVGLAGFSLTTGAVTALLEGEGVPVTWGGIAAAVFLVVAVALLVRYLRALLDHGIGGALALGGTIAIAAMLPVLWRDPAFALPATVAGIGGLVLLAASVVLGRRARRLDDPVVDPVDRSDRYASRRPVLSTLVTGEWMFVTATIVLSLVLWVLHATLA